MRPTTLDAAIKAVVPFIEQAKHMREKRGELLPVFFVFTATPPTKGDIACFIWGCEEDKDEAARVMRIMTTNAYLEQRGLWGCLLITDSRISTLDAAGLASKLGLSVAAVVQRFVDDVDFRRRHSTPQDTLVVSLETYVGDYLVMLKYREAGDRIVWEQPEVMQKGAGNIEGRFIGLLPPLPAADGATA